MYRRPLRSDEIYHSWLSKGAQKKNHKYIARINLGDKFRYFYDMAQLAAYNAAKAGGQAVDTVKKAANDVSETVHNSFYRNEYKKAMDENELARNKWNEHAADASARYADNSFERGIAREYDQNYKYFKKKYDNTIAGKAEKVANKVKNVVDTKITGEKYKKRHDVASAQADNEHYEAIKSYSNAMDSRRSQKRNYGTIDEWHQEWINDDIKDGDYHAKRAESARKGAKSAMNDYYTKSLKGRAEKAIQNAENFVSGFFKKNKKKKVSEIGDAYYSALDSEIHFNRSEQLIKESSEGNYRDHEWMNDNKNGKHRKKRK